MNTSEEIEDDWENEFLIVMREGTTELEVAAIERIMEKSADAVDTVGGSCDMLYLLPEIPPDEVLSEVLYRLDRLLRRY